MSDGSFGNMSILGPQCPLCGGSYEHDKDCELSALPIPLVARLSLEEARREARRRAEQEKSDS